MAENSKNNFESNVEALFKGLDNFLTTKSVVGQPVEVGDSIMIPLADVSFGLGAGALSNDKKDNGAGGMGAKVSPSAVLLIAKDGTTKLVNLKNQDALAKIIDMAPDVVTKIKNGINGKKENADEPEFEE